MLASVQVEAWWQTGDEPLPLINGDQFYDGLGIWFNLLLLKIN